jgi:hypothetical protein
LQGDLTTGMTEPLEDTALLNTGITSADFAALRDIESAVPVKPNHVVRLELMGLVRDRASGIELTPAGRRALKSFPNSPALPAAPSTAAQDRDSIGRRKGGSQGRNNRFFRAD